MSGLSMCVQSLRRLPRAKLRRHKFMSSIIKCKAHNMVIEEDKFSEAFEAIYFENSSLTWLHKVTPAFPVDGSQVSIFYEPVDFYSALKEKCKSAERRITFASLYIGTGTLEIELLNSVKEAIERSGGNVKVNVLLDYMRGSRGQTNSKEILKPLLNGKFGQSCQVFLYHTPKLRGLLKTLIPNRFNELIGLQHMKLYIIDDTLIISGANLSSDYFKNRQDRYFMIENCKDLCDFYCDLVKNVSDFSFKLQPDGSLDYNDIMDTHPFLSTAEDFSEEASEKIRKLFLSEMNKRSELNKEENLKTDTWIFPLVQMGQLNIRHDSEITLKILRNAPQGAVLRLATGYFNLTTEYREAILHFCRANCHLLTAHPKANGFFGAKGVAGGIPAAYTKIEKSFFQLCHKMKQNNRIQLWEFIRPGWTYHAKGLWYSLPGEQKPSFTLIGSPNFGYRSVERDLETQIAIKTTNKQLQDSLQKEYERLFESAKPVTKKTFAEKERIPPAWVRVAVYFFRYYF